MILTVRSPADLDQHRATIENATVRAISALAAAGHPVETLRRMKFEELGYHPIDGRPLDLIEQINQTFTFLVALKSPRQLRASCCCPGG